MYVPFFNSLTFTLVKAFSSFSISTCPMMLKISNFAPSTSVAIVISLPAGLVKPMLTMLLCFGLTLL